MNTKVMFSSVSDEWNTPKSLFNQLDKEFHFDSDPCPSSVPLKKGLKNEWGKRVFVNPPYSDIKNWVQMCWGHVNLNDGVDVVVLLIPSRTDTKYWHEYVMKAKEIRFIKGRLKFSGHKNSAPFPSAVVVFGGLKHG